MESDAPYGTYDIRITESGSLGFTREGYTYTFNCKLPWNKRFTLRIFTKPQKTVIQIGKRRKKAKGLLIQNGIMKKTV